MSLGKRVSLYRLRGDLGSGNFSTVKMAVHQLTSGRRHATKRNCIFCACRVIFWRPHSSPTLPFGVVPRQTEDSGKQPPWEMCIDETAADRAVQAVQGARQGLGRPPLAGTTAVRCGPAYARNDRRSSGTYWQDLSTLEGDCSRSSTALPCLTPPPIHAPHPPATSLGPSVQQEALARRDTGLS